MSVNLLELFVSKEYRFLCWLKSKEQRTSHGTVINFSQEEIAVEYGSSPATINKWLRALQAVGCVEQRKKGSYCVTQTGNNIITQMQEIEQIIRGGTICKSTD